MASILDRYGIKEVADVTFYDLDENGKPTRPVLFLDTLKVSTIEQTAENTEARGGKGNAMLISWDYNKEINVTLEDALFSAKSMAIMFGNGHIKKYDSNDSYIMKTETFVANATTTVTHYSGALQEDEAGFAHLYELPNGKTTEKYNVKYFNENGDYTTSLENGQKYFASFDILVKGSVIEISANSFPGTYYITGDTYARSEASGDDEFFQFIIPKAKVTSENTITLEAEGDPSVFNMNLRVLRPLDGKMMKLVKYDIKDIGEAPEDTDIGIYHNHVLNESNTTQGGKKITIEGVNGTASRTIQHTAQVVLDKDIANWAIEGNTLTYTGVSAGITNARLYDKDGNLLVTDEITVTAG